MATTGMIYIVVDGEYLVTQITNFDSYPSGVGCDILQFLRNMDTEKVVERLNNCQLISINEIKKLHNTIGNDEMFDQLYPQFTENVGIKILNIIENSENGLMLQQPPCSLDEIFNCSWIYFIDLTKGIFRVHSINSNFSTTLRTEIRLNDLPSETEFVNMFKTEQESCQELKDEIEVILNKLRTTSEYNETANLIADYVESSIEKLVDSVHSKN